mmetsp:Transcript_127699/g.397703  ORF Transcript_127699/g.397703 Transcript_127699/m.397703 type:complete len:498 (-) Transcript_127699:521-2014(-)
MRHVRELQVRGRGQVPREAVALRHHVADGRQHRDAAVLELCDPAAAEGRLVAVRAEAGGVPESHRGLHAQLRLEGARGQPHLGAGGSHSAVLEEHSHDGDHREAAIRNLSVELLLADLGIGDGRGVDDAVGPELVVVGPVLDLGKSHDKAGRQLARRKVWVLVGCEELHGKAKEYVLRPADGGDLCQGCQAVGHISKLQPDGGRKVARELEVLGHDVADASEHADPAMLDLHATAAVELKLIAVGGETRRVPEAGGGLHAQLLLECPSGEPHLGPGGPGHAILEHHPRDGGHGEAPVGQLGVQAPLLLLGVGDAVAAEHAEVAELHPAEGAIVAGEHPRRVGRVLLRVEELHEAAEEEHLRPAGGGHLREGLEAGRHVVEPDALRGGQVAGEADVLGRDEAHGRPHGDAAVLDLRAAAAVEGVGVAVLGQAQGVPVAQGRLHAELAFEGPAGEPHLRPRRADEAVLEHHSHDGNHGETAVGELCVQGPLALLRILDA